MHQLSQASMLHLCIFPQRDKLPFLEIHINETGRSENVLFRQGNTESQCGVDNVSDFDYLTIRLKAHLPQVVGKK